MGRAKPEGKTKSEWGALSDEDLLRSAQLWKRDRLSNIQGLTLACILLFGKDETILSVLPHHRTDSILRRENVDRYDDRDDIRTNLLESYDRIMAFGKKHLKDPFYLEGNQRTSLRSIILREVVGNLLIHREYTDAFPAKFVIEHDLFFAENGNKPHNQGLIDPKYCSPYPKNPNIARVFKEIGLADELGSGVRKLFMYAHEFCGANPKMTENYIFRVELPLVKVSPKMSPKVSSKVSPKNSRKNLKNKGFRKTPTQKMSSKILSKFKKKPTLTLHELATVLKTNKRTLQRCIRDLKDDGKLRRIGPANGGYWEVL